MNEYAISVIIPVYNGEKYLNKCLNSVINQTMFKKCKLLWLMMALLTIRYVF